MDPDPVGLVHTRAMEAGAVPTLSELGREFGTAKTRTGPEGVSITDHYEPIISPLRSQPIRLLEIGVKAGASLRMWKAYFPEALIYGIDLNERAKEAAEDRITVFLGSQADKAFLAQVAEAIGAPVDIVVDDGSHRLNETRTSLETLWPHLRSGGLYFVEDLHTSYREKYEMTIDGPNTIGFLAGLAHDLHTKENARPPLLKGLAEIRFLWRLCLLRKRAMRS